jgi:hypothetical protein
VLGANVAAALAPFLTLSGSRRRPRVRSAT